MNVPFPGGDEDKEKGGDKKKQKIVLPKKKKETKRKRKVIGSKEPLKIPTRSSDKPKPFKKWEDPYTIQKERMTTIQPPVAVNLGIITWNVAHFGAEPINLQTACATAIDALQELVKKLNEGYLEWLLTFDPWLVEVRKAAKFKLNKKSERSLSGMLDRSAGLSRLAYKEFLDVCKLFDAFWKKEKLTDNDFHGSWEYLFQSSHGMGKTLREMRATLRRLREPMNRIQRLEKFFTARDTKLPRLKPLSWVYDYYINQAWAAIIVLDKAAHRILVMKNIVHMFKVNKWLDVVALHEVNKGIDILSECMAANGLLCIRGPHLRSVSGNKSQDEYYPIIVRKSLTMLVHQRFAFFNDGTRRWGLADGEEVTWSKTAKRFRPVVGYEIRLERWGWRTAMVAIVHTTPYGKEFQRQKVFQQVELPLDAFSYSSIPVSVSGDYYLTAESAVHAMKDLDLDKGDKIYVREYWKWYKAQQEELRKKREAEEIRKLLDPNSNKMEEDEKPIPEDDEDESEGEDEDDEDEGEAEDSDPVREIEIVNKFDVFRNELGLTFQSRMEDMQLDVLQPITGTNWKTKQVVRWRAAQVADFYVLKHWLTKAAGIPDPDGGVAWADAEDMRLSEYWRISSDHWPVAAYLSTHDEKDQVDLIFHLMKDL